MCDIALCMVWHWGEMRDWGGKLTNIVWMLEWEIKVIFLIILWITIYHPVRCLPYKYKMILLIFCHLFVLYKYSYSNEIKLKEKKTNLTCNKLKEIKFFFLQLPLHLGLPFLSLLLLSKLHHPILLIKV